MSWWLISLRASAWPLVAIVVGFFLSGLIDRIAGSSPYFVQFASASGWVFLASLIAAGVLWLLSWRSLRAWEQGEMCCDRCSGPLGWLVHSGRVYYGKQLPDFRRCYNCGKATSEL